MPPLHKTPLFAALLLILSAAPARAADVLFSRHVVGVFSRLGCNSGACHGAVKGQNGFRLTLFGADPALDHERLLREFNGRRVNLLTPIDSLFMQKALGRMPHQGGALLTTGSPEYRILNDWLMGGASLDDVSRSLLKTVKASAPSGKLEVGATMPIRVEATFADGSTEDVTGLCTFESNNMNVAPVDRMGLVSAKEPGDAVVIARYRGQPAMTVVVVPVPAAAAALEFPQVNFIDKHIADRLKAMNLQPAPKCDDATFLRRVYLDVVGMPPTPDEIRVFLADTKPDRRARLIDELLQRPGYAAMWATRFADLLRPTGFEGKAGLNEVAESRRVYEWLRARVQENIPYDQLAERILTATSREGRGADAWAEEIKAIVAENGSKTADLKAYQNRRTLDLYWQRTNSGGVKGAVRVAHAFLGLRMECAQCHRHPHDVWQQDDLLSFANFFNRINLPTATPSAEAAKAADEMTKQAKKLKDDAKQQADKGKSGSKEEQAKAQAEAKALNEKAKTLDDTAKRLKSSEVNALGKSTNATVVSPLGKQSSERYRLLGTSENLTIAADQDPRTLVAAWMRRPDNPFFAKAFVNRAWAHYFGRGIIDPPDHLSPLNPPSHPELLKELADDFIKNGFDLKHLHRRILNSHTYQLSAQTNEGNRHDKRNYASFYPRRLPAEVLVDAVNHATAGTETFPEDLRVPSGSRALEVAGVTGGEKGSASLHYPFMIFGRPLRIPDGQCDCERDATPTIVQTLYLTNHPKMRAKLALPDGRVARIAKEIMDESKRIDEIYLWTLSRLPDDAERKTCLAYVQSAATPQRGLEDVMWSLLNTHEFLLQH